MKSLNSRGQVLLAVILVAVVALTIGLSLVSRSITSVRVAGQSEESQRAFQAAEAGVEKALSAVRLSPTPPSSINEDEFSNNSTYEAEITPVEGGEFFLNDGEELAQDVGTDIWLAEYPDYLNPFSGTIRVHFGSGEQSQCLGSGEDVVPAVEILVLSGSIDDPTLSKSVVDPCGRISGALAESGSGSSAEYGGKSMNFAYYTDLNMSNALVARFVPIYNSSKAAVTLLGGGALPSQGTIVESVGKSGESVRRVRVYKSNPQIPIELFQYAILSQ